MENDDRHSTNRPITNLQDPVSANTASAKKNNMRKRVTLLFVVAALVIGGAFLAIYNDKNIQDSANNNDTIQQGQDLPGANLEAALVSYTDEGFVPSTVRVQAGQSVTWTNSHAGLLVVASDPHPEHDGLEGLESESIDQDSTYSYTFSEQGTYTYHNHLDPTVSGTIVVE